VAAGPERWVLLNASPDIRAQIGGHPVLHPSAGELRGSPIVAVFLTGAEIDEMAGLLSLRESSPFDLYASRATLDRLAANPMFSVLSSVGRHAIEPGKTVPIGAGLAIEPIAIGGKLPLYLERSGALAGGEETSFAFAVQRDGASAIFMPACAAIDDALARRLEQADVIFFDGTFFTADEMIRQGTGQKTGRQMGHMAIGGPDGSLARFAGIPGKAGQRRIYIHINNTNPILIDGSPEREMVEQAGWDLAFDGLRIAL
jgi:pyrroloquinoline quinone biosynthesis protein B